MDMVETLDPLVELQAQSERLGWGGSFAYATRFDHPSLNDVLALWLERSKGGIPRRSEFDARTLTDVLPHLWMIETVRAGAPARYRCRRMGTEVAKVFGEMTGRFLDEAIPDSLLARWTIACERLLCCRRPVRFTCKVDLPRADFLYSEAFHAPLLDSRGEPTILMGVNYFRSA